VDRERPSGAADAPARPAGLVPLVPLDPRVRTAWWLEGAGLAAVVTAAAAVAAAVFGFGAPPRVALVVGVPAALMAGFGPVLRYRRWRYALAEAELWLCFGVVRRTVSVIPFSRLQFVDTKQGPLDRALGLARLVVHTAALGTSGVLPGLDAAAAAGLRNRLAATLRDSGV
jgi:uncharacterized protein